MRVRNETPGISIGLPAPIVSMMTLPVLASYSPLDFLTCQSAAAGNGAVEVIGVRRAERGNGTPGLRPGRRVRRMRMYDAANGCVLAIEGEVGRRVGGRRIEPSMILPSRSITTMSDAFMASVADAARLDDDNALLTVDAADVAPGKGHQTMLGQIQVSAKNFFLQLLKCHESTLHICRCEKCLGLRCPVPDAGQKEQPGYAAKDMDFIPGNVRIRLPSIYAHYGLDLQGNVQNFPFF